MKNILSVILLFTTVITQAQNHITAKVNLTHSIWTIFNPEFPNEVTTLGTFENDTIMNDGIKYLCLFYSNRDTVTPNDRFYAGIRFDSISNRMYYFNGNNDKKVLFDFSLQPGDTMLYENGYMLVIPGIDDSLLVILTSCDSITTLDGVTRKRFRFGSDANIVIEGIGMVNRYPFSIMNAFTLGHAALLGCYKQAGKCLYTTTTCNTCYGNYVGLRENDIKRIPYALFPNPVSDILYLKPQAEKINQIAIYNINGQLIRSLNYKQLLPQNAIDVATLPNGIYQIILVADGGGIFSNRFVKQ